ncbi:MAG: D-glycero-beta-D-manno-heptose-7-phosphate kinase [Candidatus Omnitrophota bacterium]
MKLDSLKEIISKFPKANILVMGDIILDEFIWGSVNRISPEAPVPVVWANRRSFMPGGSANVASNITSLGAKADLIGVIGRDKNTDLLLSEIKKRRISTRGIFIEPNRHTTLKTRIIAGHQQVVRVDWEHTDSLPKELNQKIINFVKNNIKKYDAVIIEDYGKGVINTNLLEEIILIARKNKKVITVDPKEENFLYYHGATSITPNRKELENAVRNLKIKDKTNRFKVHNDCLFNDKDIDLAANQILEYLDLDSILVTLGEHGMRLFEKKGTGTHIPTVAQEVFDVSGAGDTVIAVFSLALASGATKPQAAYIANFAAGIVVGKLGTAVIERKELLERIDNS